MFLKDISRPVALGLVFVTSFIVAVLLLPISLGLAFTASEGLPSNPNLAEAYWGYLVSLATWSWPSDQLVIIGIVVPASVWAILTVAFLAPITGRVRLLQHGRSLRSSVAVARSNESVVPIANGSTCRVVAVVEALAIRVNDVLGTMRGVVERGIGRTATATRRCAGS